MNANHEQSYRDEQLLIDFLLGKCDQAQAEEVVRRLRTDEAFHKLHDDLNHTFAAFGALPEPVAAGNLTERALQMIRQSGPDNTRLAASRLGGRSAAPTFSLRELAGIAAAVVLMAAIFIPSMRAARRQELQRRCASQVGQIGAALTRHAIANSGVLPNADHQQRRWLPINGEPMASTSAGLFKLVKDQYVPAAVFVCPATASQPARYVIHLKMTDFPSDSHISYSYQHTLGERRISLYNPRLKPVAEQMAVLADSSPVFTGGQFNPDRITSSSDNHHGKGQNIWFLAGHVAWSPTPAAGVAGNNIYLIEGLDSYRGDETPTDETDTFLLPAYSRGSNR